MAKTYLANYLLVLFSAAVLFFYTQPSAFAKNETTGWILDQYCESLGAIKIFLSEKGIKIWQQRVGTTLLCTAPNWKVCQFNSRTKRQCFSDPQHYEAFHSGLAALSMGVKFSNIAMQSQGEGEVLGMKTNVFTYGKPTSRRYGDHERHDRYMAIDGLVSAKYQISQSIKVPQVLEGLHARFLGVPVRDGVPLDLAYSDVEGRRLSWLATQSCRRTSFKEGDFAPPQGYKSVASQTELTVQDGEASGLNDMLEMTRSK